MSLEGKIQVQSDLAPTNDNPRMPVTKNEYIQGAPQVFKDLAELVAFHPNRMKAGMPATILNYPSAGTISDYRLQYDPVFMLDSNKNSLVTVDNFSQFWILISQTETKVTRVYQYSADGPGGGAPVYPYTIPTESNWANTFDSSKSHRWMRFRDDDVDDNSDGIYDNWTVPIPINNAYVSGDYLENRFKRQAVSSTLHTNSSGLQADKYYIIESGQIQIDGDLSLNDIGAFPDTQTTYTLGTGRIFKYAAANTYTFLSSGTVTETVPPPPRTISGLPNNEPAGWSDTIPGGTNQLWQITGQKSVYGQLKSDWIIQKIIENPSYIRYGNKPTPHPDTIAGVNTSANTGSPEDLALIAEGWDSAYNEHSFIAKRQDDPGPNLYTNWLVEKINEESGEYTDRVFKLFDFNLDTDSPALTAPTLRDPTQEGWSDTPLTETDTQINYISEARKFFNGELKTPWSNPVPYTGKDTFSDVIESDLGDNFKYDQLGNVVPASITLKGNLYKGISELWQNAALTITYTWKIVYDDGAIADISPTTNPADDFYLLGVNGSPGDADYARANQRVVLKPAAVNGHTVIRCTQVLSMVDGDDITFEDEFSMLDVTDGKDAKSFSVTSDNQRIIYDTGGAVFTPATVVLRAYWSNINSPTLYWYRWNGSSWSALTNGVGGYTIGGNSLQTASSNIFAADSTAQEIRYAVSTHASNPDSANNITTFSDYITVAKLAGTGLGAPGADALIGILSNESHTVVLDSTTGTPQAGEITSSGKAKTTLQVYEGLTKLDYTTDYTISLSDDNANITFGSAANGTDVDIYVATWGANERSVVCTIEITYGSVVFTKKFSLSSTQDAPGAVLLDIDSNKGFTFTPTDKTDKTLTAKLYDTALSGDQEVTLPDAAYTFRWNIAGVWTSLTTSNTTTVTRSNILVTGKVTAEVYKDAALFRSRTITIADVNDGKSYRAWTSNATKPSASQDLSSQDPTNGGIWPVTVSGVVWRLPTDAHWATNVPTYAQDADVNAGVYTWGPVYQLKGEKGDQGGNGDFFFPMYKASDNTPANPANWPSSTLAEMQAAGWSAKPPNTGRIWRSERMWNGEGVSFDVNGNPSTTPVTGSTWAAMIPITGTNGINADPGVDGDNGWSPLLAIVPRGTAGEKVHQLVDWTGGEGTKPGGIGQYLSPSGLTSDINVATNISGTPIELRLSSGWIQWKYTDESSLAWRNLYQKEFSGWLKSFAGGGPTNTNPNGSWCWIDTGDTTSKKLSITAYMDAYQNTDYTMRLEGNNAASFSGGTILIHRNYMTYDGGSIARQYVMHYNITTSFRYIILKIGTFSGSGGLTSYFGLTVAKTD